MKVVLLVVGVLLATADALRGSKAVFSRPDYGMQSQKGLVSQGAFDKGRPKHRGALQQLEEEQHPGSEKKQKAQELSVTIGSRQNAEYHYTAPPPAVGLPDEDCITYRERYTHLYHRTLHHSAAANSLNPHSKFVVLMKMHMAWFDKVPQDLLLALRAAALETTLAGYHFYILQHVPNHVEERFTREEMLGLLPMDLRPFIIIHDEEDALNAYPLIREEGGDWGPGPKAAYVGISNFMQKYAYDYCYVAEYDSRWTGRSWGHLLNAALNLAAQATEEELEADPFRRAKMDRVASRELPRSYEGLPDLLSFGHGGIGKTEHWRPVAHNMDDVPLYEMAAVVYLGSRKFWDAVHERSMRGEGAHLEAFLASVAMAEGLKAVAIDLPPHEKFEEYHHCCRDHAGVLYSGWFNNTAECIPGYLVHPVRTSEPFWPRAQFAGSQGLIH